MAGPAHAPDSMNEAIGAIAIGWANLEFSLAIVLGVLLHTDHVTAIVASAALDHRHRRNLINSLGAIKLQHTPSSLAALNSFMGEVKGLAKIRNEAVHSLLSSDPDTGRPMRFVTRNDGVATLQFKRTSARYLLAAARKMNDAANHAAGPLSLQIKAGVAAWQRIPQPPFPPHQAPEANHQEANPDKH